MTPDTARRPLSLGSVVAVGAGGERLVGPLIPPSVAPGDQVALKRGSGMGVTLGGEQLIVASEQDILWNLRPGGACGSALLRVGRPRRGNRGA